ncbi:MAG: hypothetical protein A2868_02985 [Candidatus Levybacteria bacterium RIFCSPHIGHO2_01_FULL_40_15b]|nr:MAG: hypothetical protein A2868_02985 [Candidatus Levybacteria bacterium RIFCSPHIGHO2_01_FULL_40_15b]
MRQKKIPQKLQGVLWSRDVRKLDPEQDKDYVIHQTLSYGGLDEILWLFRAYEPSQIVKTFTTTPFKDYRKARFYFVKNILLNLEDHDMNELLYVKNIPRDIRP